jgi:glycosyltransferase involved in cell wall biosynthesis
MTPSPTPPENAAAPLATAIIIFLNGEKYIAEAIESVLSQTMTDWELILVDDGSTDGATAIARDDARAWPGRIVYVEHPGHENRGMSASRNLGLKAARGRYVGFLDADDVWAPEHLRVYTRILEATPSLDLVFGRTLLWYSWDDPAKVDGVIEHELPCWRVLEPPTVLRSILETYGRSVPGICAIVARREAVLAAGGFDESFRTLYEDQVFFARMFLGCRSMAVDCVLDRYRQHPESACNSAGGLKGDMEARPRFLDWLGRLLDERGVRDPGLRAALARNVDRVRRPWKQKLKGLPAAAATRAFRKLPRPIRDRLSGPFYALMALGARRPPPPGPAEIALRDRFLEGVDMAHDPAGLPRRGVAKRLHLIDAAA